MSNPTSTDVHVDAALTQLAIGWGAQNYIWDQVCPVVPVSKQSDKYYIFDADRVRRDEATLPRAPGTVANRGGYGVSTDSYYCDNWAWGKQTPFEVVKQADPALNIDENDTKYVTEVVNRRLEIEQAGAVFAASKWALDIAGGSSVSTNQVIYWSTYATSTPIADVRAQADAMQLATGFRPNKIWLGRPVFTALLDHPDFLDRLSYAQTKVVQLQILATLFEVDQVIVGQASYNTAAEKATASNSWVHGKNALLYYAPPSASMDVPSAMYSFRWGPRTILNYEDTPPGKRARVIECHDYVDFVLTASSLGRFFSGIVA